MIGELLLFLATLALITGFILLGNQEIYYLGKLTVTNISFFILTWLFALLSVVSLVATFRCLKRPGGRILRFYLILASCTYVAWAFFLWYWGIIGLKLWI